MIVSVKALYELVDANPIQLETDGDELMRTLLRLEAEDSRVRDAAVSLDLGRCEVEVESICEAPDYETAATLARERIALAVREVLGQTMVLHERRSELISA